MLFNNNENSINSLNNYSELTKITVLLFCYIPGCNNIELIDKKIIIKNIEQIINLSKEENLIPLLYISLKKINILNEIDNSFKMIIENEYYKNILRNIKYANDIKKIHNFFYKAKINYILLKEYNLDNTYKDSAAVYKTDIDILINKNDLDFTKKILFNEGYKIKKIELSPHQFVFDKENHYSIDLHISLNPFDFSYFEYKLNYNKIFNRVINIFLDNTKIPILNPIDNIIYLISHISLNHNFYPFSKIVNCINYLISHQDIINWNEISKEFKQLNINNIGWFTLKYIEAITGCLNGFHKYFNRPNFFDIKLFFLTKPNPSEYFSKKAQIKLKIKHNGLALIFLLDTLKQKIILILFIIKNMKTSIKFSIKKNRLYKVKIKNINQNSENI
jgi:Uncharacterised nucleotidyltransferase